jgi:hypothetical protein
MDIKTYCLKMPTDVNAKVKMSIVTPKKNMNDWILEAITEKLKRDKAV